MLPLVQASEPNLEPSKIHFLRRSDGTFTLEQSDCKLASIFQSPISRLVLYAIIFLPLAFTQDTAVSIPDKDIDPLWFPVFIFNLIGSLGLVFLIYRRSRKDAMIVGFALYTQLILALISDLLGNAGIISKTWTAAALKTLFFTHTIVWVCTVIPGTLVTTALLWLIFKITVPKWIIDNVVHQSEFRGSEKRLEG